MNRVSLDSKGEVKGNVFVQSDFAPQKSGTINGGQEELVSGSR